MKSGADGAKRHGRRQADIDARTHDEYLQAQADRTRPTRRRDFRWRGRDAIHRGNRRSWDRRARPTGRCCRETRRTPSLRWLSIPNRHLLATRSGRPRSSRWLPPAADRTRAAVGAVRRSRRCRRGGNDPSTPFVGSSASAVISTRHRYSQAFASLCPSPSGPAAGARCRKPGRPRTTTSPASRPRRGRTSACRQANVGFAGRGDHREPRRNSRPDPAA